MLAFLLWFAGLTVVGIFVVYGTVCFRGFTFGYSISSVIATLGAKRRNKFYLLLYVTAKHNIYSCFICNGNKWNKVI